MASDRLSPHMNDETNAVTAHDASNGLFPHMSTLNGHYDQFSSDSPSGHPDHLSNGALNSNQGSFNGHSTTNGTSYGQATPIAICGMALRLPGGSSTPQQLWDFLVAKGDARSKVPQSRYNAAAFHSTSGKPASVGTEYGYFLDETNDLGALDTSFFSMSRTEVERADPQQRLMLEVARECFEDAGITNWRGKAIGCYVGSFGEDWLDLFAKETQPWGRFRVTGTGDFMLSNRLSYEMDLRGPRYVPIIVYICDVRADCA